MYMTAIAVQRNPSIVVTPGGRPTVAVIKRWPANTGPNTCYGDFGAHYLAVL